MKFLGIRDGHDCNVTYTDGTTVRYVKLERNLQMKHYHWGDQESSDTLPKILLHAKKLFDIDLDTLDAVCYSYGNEHHKFDRFIELDELYFKANKASHPFWNQFKCPVYQIDHHYAHVLSCWPLINLDKVDTHFVFDGLGDHGRTASVHKNNKVVDFTDRTDNLGLSVTMEHIGQQIGMKGMVLDISGKLMALKSFHDVPNELRDTIMGKVESFHYRHLTQFINVCLKYLKQLPGRNEEKTLINLAYMLHVFGEQKLPEYFLKYAAPSDTITYSGGTAQNTVVNTFIRKQYNNIYIPPHCPDDGISLGCVELLRTLYQQPHFDNSGFPYWQSDAAPSTSASSATIEKAAEYLARGKIVAWYQGSGELGPRALGNRSILMDPSIRDGKDIINKKVKKRESYRPFGASVLLEHTSKHFDCDFDSPYMLYVVDCLSNDFPSIMHVDKTCRIQTVSQEPQYETYHTLIDSFYRKTGIPLLLNTSLNVDGKPIAAYPDDATTLFDQSELDVVIVGDDIMVKNS
jgi:carbamoyltransferase